MTNSLFGDEFEIKVPDSNIKGLLKKVNGVSTVVEDDPEKVLKSKKLALHERLNIITTNVLKVLGKQKNNVIVIKDKQSFNDYITKAIASGRIAIDTETNNSLDPVTCKLMGPCFYYPGGKQAYVPINHRNPDTKERLAWQLTEQDCQEIFNRIIDSKIDIIMHNGKFDYEVIKCTCGVAVKPTWDTMVCARLLNENELASLKSQYVTKIDKTQEKYDIEKLFEHVSYADVDPDIFALYAATDSMMTDKLYELQAKEMSKDEYGPHLDITGKHEIKGLRWLFHEVEMPIVIVTAEMELRGVKVDTEFGDRLKKKYNDQLTSLDTKIENNLQLITPLISAWKNSYDATEQVKTYVPAKTKMSREKIEATYPNIDKDGNRYKVGKAKNAQIEDPINLASPTQLAILFYDILRCPTVSKKSSRGTGEGELKAIADALKNPEVVNTMAANVADYLIPSDKTKTANQVSQAVITTTEEIEETEDENNLFDDFFEDEQEVVEQIIKSNAEAFDISSQDTIIKNFIELVPAVSELVGAILKRRGIVKLITTYIDVIPELAKHWPDGRIRFHLNSLGTDTGRYSSGGKIKYLENDEPVEVSGINIQNIPSHNPEIRMLFQASSKEHKVELNNDYYEIIETDEVETTNGWKKVQDLIIGDTIIGDDNQDIIKNIVKQNRTYLLYV